MDKRCGKCNSTASDGWWACCPAHKEQYGDLCEACALSFHPEMQKIGVNRTPGNMDRSVVPLPQTIDILGRIYAVYTRMDQCPPGMLNGPSQGTVSWKYMAIYIDTSHPLTNLKSTIIHEIVHTLLNFAKDPDGDGYKTEFKDVHELEEFICSSVDDGLGYVLSHNPALVAYLAQ